MKHRISWILWLVVSLYLALTTRNPYYLSLQLLELSFLGYFLAIKKGSTKWLTSNIRFIGIVLLLSGVINTLFSHQGKTIIFKLPQQWLIIGGAFTLEKLNLWIDQWIGDCCTFFDLQYHQPCIEHQANHPFNPEDLLSHCNNTDDLFNFFPDNSAQNQ